MGAQQTIESVTADQVKEENFFPNFSVGDTINVHYTIIEGENGFCMVIDPIALAYMQGAEIDYSDDGPSANFVFNNVFKAVGGSGACGGCGGSGH